ncbi:hypothetical protein AU593_004210 [Salmonella enterica subsp. enterica serovar Derby]|uniref:Lipoprotein n=1 Tax=Salmonella derby TaxID=28144 RepID=A0A1S7BGG1_SALDE|nr:hypothetical protein [Salmonella enterica]AQX82760.1 hypothetical protein [Salmonella enterica subsp. enterica serovar Derby]EBQ8844199.1 hypothetical protein [Salmonella enterica subsp. enterica serovar Derby]ECN3092388.1 hypothetical protein [Salmonella enterica subsp. enterica serovar Derby]EDG5172573.1 hypothetical protein [Salmonella enterica subsp. enterica serovar Derby]EDS8550637.1 hypothetical protein [Salmonella enterica subsp. enterica serovar Derby]
MGYKFFVIGFISVTMLTACSTSSVPATEAKFAPQNRVLKYQIPTETTLTIVRDKGLTGSGCNATIFINGDNVAKLKTGEKATFYLSEGEWVVGSSLESSGLCALNPSRMEREVKLNNGDTKKYRVYTSWDGTMELLPTTL